MQIIIITMATMTFIIIIIFDAHGQRPPLNKRSAAPHPPLQIWQTQSHQRASNMSNPIMAKPDMANLTNLRNIALNICVSKYEQSKLNKAGYKTVLISTVKKWWF